MMTESLSHTTKNLFGEEQVQTLYTLFDDMLKNTLISKPVIFGRLF